jgi:purine-binding chemotaxis protein CheW
MKEEMGMVLDAEQVKQFIGFTIDREEFGIELPRVKEVIRIQEITRVPGATSCMRGIINLRGTVIPLLDLREKFGLTPQEYGAMTRVIVVELEGNHIGMVVDSASQVVRIATDMIDPTPRIPGQVSRGYVAGVGKREEGMMMLVDVERMFSSEELDGFVQSAAGAVAGAVEGGGS